MENVNVEDMQRDFPGVLERVAKGQEIVITSAGSPIAKLIPFHSTVGPRVPGYWKGKVRIAPDFDVLPPELSAAFRGETP